MVAAFCCAPTSRLPRAKPSCAPHPASRGKARPDRPPKRPTARPFPRGSNMASSETTTADRSAVTEGASPGVIPTSQLVILKESELDCDVATAIQRIRDNEETARHRILVIAPDDGRDGTGGPRTHIPTMPTTLAQVARRSECDVLAQANKRVVPLLACLERFLDEARVAWKELDASIEEAPRARLRNQSTSLREILEWAGAVTEDLRREASGTEAGLRTVDTRGLLFEMAGQIETLFPGVRVQLLPGGSSHCIGRAAELAEAFYLALALTAQRIGGR